LFLDFFYKICYNIYRNNKNGGNKTDAVKQAAARRANLYNYLTLIFIYNNEKTRKECFYDKN